MRTNYLSRTFAAAVIALLSYGVSNAQGEDQAPVTAITLNGDSIAVDGIGATVEGSTVTITAAGTYSLTGSLTDGQVAVNSEDAELVTLILNGVNISNSSSAAINIINAESAAIVVTEGTQNYVSDAETYVYANPEDDEPNAAIFSDDDLTISGSGTLTVDAHYNDGIASKDGLTISDATITVNSVDDGIRGKDYLLINSGNITVTSQGDALKSDNDEDTSLGYITIENGVFKLTNGGDGIAAETAATINNGEFTIVTAGGNQSVISEDLSAKAIKAGTTLLIENGTFALDAADDGLHSNDKLIVNNGTFNIAVGDDAIHADNSVEINNGVIDITNSLEGIEGVVITINDGNIHLVSRDDGLNAAGDVPNYHLYINGGYVVVKADGDGIDSNGSITITDGVVIVHGPTANNNAAVDYDGTFTMSGGFLVAAGSAGMAQTSSGTQNALLLNLSAVQPAGTLVSIQSADGQEVLTFAPEKSFQSIAVSSPNLVTGATYNVYLGGSYDGSASDGLYSGGTYTPGTQYTSFTINSTVTQIGEQRRRGRP
ncbi:MAG: carbohydrate-binding domain-containing protein [Anaerolineae bacterium]